MPPDTNSWRNEASRSFIESWLSQENYRLKYSIYYFIHLFTLQTGDYYDLLVDFRVDVTQKIQCRVDLIKIVMSTCNNS